jgi:phosphoribosylaminoimidazolecarboxamide formyltransferase / IMP cyclohydrolase
MDKVKIKRALISVSDKAGLVDLAKTLDKYGVEIISTGGTAKALEAEGIKTINISDVTEFPEMLDGRVKTLHPAVHGGLLARRDLESHMNTIKEHGIIPIDMVVVNLYPFEATVAKPGVKREEAIENIDIGGPSMLRSAAKNADAVAVIVNPDRYSGIIEELEANDGSLGLATRMDLQKEVFKTTAAYDAAISAYLGDAGEVTDFPETLTLKYKKVQDCRYGENPHQRAAYYSELAPDAHALVNAKKLHGKELSFNNVLDMNAAWSLTQEFNVPAVVVVKHNNPCGVALDGDISAAYQKAWDADTVSAFGGVIALNKPVTKKIAEHMKTVFIEVVVAPGYDADALEILTQKKDIRLLVMDAKRNPHVGDKDFKKVDGGLLVQDLDISTEDREDMTIATKRHPTEAEWEDLLFAWRVCKHVKSNTIILAKDMATVGVGAGQMSRVISATIAGIKAGDAAKNSVLASDAYFPFRDGVEEAAKVGAVAVIQPGGSIRDPEVIAAAEEFGMAMVFTGHRHFRH